MKPTTKTTKTLTQRLPAKRKKLSSSYLSIVVLFTISAFIIVVIIPVIIIPFQRRQKYDRRYGNDDITTTTTTIGMTSTTVSRILYNNNRDDDKKYENDNSQNDGDDDDKNNEPNQQQQQQPKIPYNLIFTYKTNILHTRSPPNLHKNIVHTIESYKSAIRRHYHDNNNSPPPPVRVYFLDDALCHDTISSIYPPLLPFFESETFGVFRGDVCRIAALYRYGGYYFDVDMEVVEPLVLLSPSSSSSSEIDFATVIQPHREDFFQSFVAAAEGHPILRRTLRNMLKVYEGRERREVDLLGTMTLRWGYDEVMAIRKKIDKGLVMMSVGDDEDEVVEVPEGVMLLEEVPLLSPRYGRMYPGLIREGYFGCCCNYVVHDPRKQVVHFYSRIVGYSKRCSFEPVEGM